MSSIVMRSMAVLVLVFGIAAAEERPAAKASGLGSWLKELQRKMDIINPRKTVPVTTGVAGVRGAKDDARPALYWKGAKGEEPVSEEELKEFREGLAFAEAGDTAMAAHELEEFMKLYPDSALIPDAKKTLDLVKAEGK